MGIKVVLGYGLGSDSTAILLRWIHEPATRPCALSELLVVTAMTGDEWTETGRLVRSHVLPLLRAHGIRYVQLARHGARKADGITVLDDSPAPAELHIDGDYKLSQEMNGNGTVPQVGGIRKCSMHAKGEVIDRWLARELGGAPFLHAIGFEANELTRALRDARYDTEGDAPAGRPANRTGFYPLIEWGWDRAKCEAYITARTGAAWIKSACTYCPFALATKAGQERVKVMYSREPGSGVAALAMEYLSISLNPSQGLIKEGSLLRLLLGTGDHGPVLRAWGRQMQAGEWRVYEVRRVAMPTEKDPSKGSWNRSVRSVAAGDRDEMLAELARVAAAEGITVETDGLSISRAYRARRGEGFPAFEHLYAVAPAGAQDKEPKAFGTTYARYQAHAAAAL